METISAVSTPSGTGGVAIIRISGPKSFEIAKKMFEPSAKNCGFIPNMMYTGYISGEGFKDYGMCVFFKAPKSYTGEDVAELHCHGGIQIARGILAKTVALGAQPAEKGEFTKRAFLNGKMSLSSAEGIIDMINAESLASLRAGCMLYGEKLTKDVKEIQSELSDILAEIAANIDYPEEDLDGTDANLIKGKIQSVKDKLVNLSSTYSCGKKIKDGVTVAIYGRPNTGKSSLLNRLLGYDKAIVSEIAGTTRDAVEGSLQINGVKYNFIDTAGIRENAEKIENFGIERAKNIIKTADIILSVTDGSEFAEVPETGAKVLKVFNKCDVNVPALKCDICVSAKTGEGIEELKRTVSALSVGDVAEDKAYLIEQRHFLAVNRAIEALSSAVENSECTLDLISVDLNDAWDSLGEITGETAGEQIINRVFEKFCVGK